MSTSEQQKRGTMAGVSDAQIDALVDELFEGCESHGIHNEPKSDEQRAAAVREATVKALEADFAKGMPSVSSERRGAPKKRGRPAGKQTVAAPCESRRIHNEPAVDTDRSVTEKEEEPEWSVEQVTGMSIDALLELLRQSKDCHPGCRVMIGEEGGQKLRGIGGARTIIRYDACGEITEMIVTLKQEG